MWYWASVIPQASINVQLFELNFRYGQHSVEHIGWPAGKLHGHRYVAWQLGRIPEHVSIPPLASGNVCPFVCWRCRWCAQHRHSNYVVLFMLLGNIHVSYNMFSVGVWVGSLYVFCLHIFNGKCIIYCPRDSTTWPLQYTMCAELLAFAHVCRLRIYSNVAEDVQANIIPFSVWLEYWESYACFI